MKISAAHLLNTRPENSTWYRAIQPQHWNTALQTAQSKVFPSRYNAGAIAAVPFEVLYLAQDHTVALFEVQALLGNPYGAHLPQPARPWSVLNVQVVLQTVADLSNHVSQQLLDLTAQELTGDWNGYQQRTRSSTLNAPTGRSPTQDLGAAFFLLPRLEAFKTISARVPDKRTIVIFPTKLRIGSFVQFTDPATNKTHTINGTMP